jgi:hypothetical protein
MAKPDKKSEPVKPGQLVAVNLPIEWHFPEGLKSNFANHMIVQQDDSDVFLSFFELQPPVITSAADAVGLKSRKSIRATCVSKVVISKARFPVFVNALTQLVPQPITVEAGDDDSPPAKNGKNGKDGTKTK